MIVSLPELARAQQTGLFPLAPIKRQRVPCDQEDPIYKTYKHQYFGYHPTCWRQFPAGWGCPSPDGPNKEESFKAIPFAPTRAAAGEFGGPPEDDMNTQPGAIRPALPPIPGGVRSPFEEPSDTDRPGAAPTNPRGGRAPLPTPPGDPFELDAPAAPRPGQARPAAPGAASNGPELSAPAEQPGAIQGASTGRNEGSNEPNANDDTGPVLALPKVNIPPLDDPGVPFGTQPPPPDTDVASNASANATPSASSATPRRGFLSGFFSNLGLNWARR